ncbi:MAG: M28 family peptidase [Candidatus Bathyarchaeota archaeon]|nr:M28 family peptidase [Candidatus Bathyarchaeota archaeon]
MPKSYPDIDRRILGEAYGSAETLENVTTLCDDYDSRWPGSGDDKASCEYMAGRLEAYGLEDVHLEKFTIPGWIRGPSTITVLEPRRKEIPCIGLPMTAGGVVEAELVDIGDGAVDVYEKGKSEIEGKIVLVNSAQPPTMARYLHRSERYQRSVLAGAAGWIFMTHYPAYGPPTGGISPIIPGVGVSYEDGTYLARVLRRKGRVKLRLDVSCKNLQVDTWNVVADLPGETKGETVVYGAHYEGHDIAVGALDDATGAAVVMEIARILAKEKRMRRGMRFILFGAEEIGLYGSRAYVHDHPGEVEATRFMMNFDAAGRYGKQGFNLHGWPQLEPFFREITAAIGPDVPLWQGVSPYSDHWPFFLRGVPTAGMGDPEENKRLGGRGFGHTRYDTVDKVNLRAMRECAANAAIAAVRIANADDWPVTLRPQEEVEAYVQAQGFKETVELGEKLKAYLNKRRKSLKPEARDYLDRLTGGWEEVI